MQKILKSIGIFAFISVSVASCFLGFDFFQNRQVFPNNTYIGEINVSNLSESQATDKLKAAPLAEIYSAVITLEASSDESYSFTPEQLGISLFADESVKQAFVLTHDKNYLNNLKQRTINHKFVAPLYLGVKEDTLGAVLKSLAEAVHSDPRDASFLLTEETGGFHVESEQNGKELNIPKSLEDVKAALGRGEKIILLAIKETPPKIREVDLRAFPPAWKLASYTTYYGNHDSPNRIHNIKLIASWMNDTILMPGDIFSVAKAIGDVTAERGFKEAFVITGGELVPQLGGGACQTATTLYNAVSLADIKVIERRNHSFYFAIYPLGRDAGVYPGQLDMKFENDTGHPILIKAVATNRRLSFRIYGTPTGKSVKFTYPRILGATSNGYVPMSLGSVIASDAPFRTSVVRTVYDAEGKKTKEETISSFYKLYGEKSNVPIRRPEPR
ncbi:MAG: VanW family protein [Candidatus Margulisiibacteriota bacterium]